MNLYDEYRKPLNKTHIRGVSLSKGKYHIVVNIWTINKNCKILIDKRHTSTTMGAK